MLDAMVCKTCLEKHPTNVIKEWADFGFNWRERRVVCCPTSLSGKVDYRQFGDLAPIDRDPPRWCAYKSHHTGSADV